MNDRHDGLEPTRAAALADEVRTLVGKLKRRLRDQAKPHDLTPSQVSVVLQLERDGPATVSSLARAEGMRPQSMGAAIAPLQAAGLIVAAPDPNDGRQSLLSLSDACRKWIAEGRAARRDWLTRMIETRFSRPEREELARAIRLFTRLIED